MAESERKGGKRWKRKAKAEPKQAEPKPTEPANKNRRSTLYTRSRSNG